MNRRVMAFTGTRADFGLLRPVLSAIEREPSLDLALVVAGSHFSSAYGRTVDEIAAAGFEIAWRIESDVHLDSDRAIAESTAATLASVAGAVEELRPAVGLVLGDRYEALAFASACLLSRVPIAHVHGGETTEGAVDDAIRNAITQMAAVHFVAAPQFGERVIALGADGQDVHVVGAPGLDTVRSVLETIDDPRRVVEDAVGPLDDAGPLFLVSYHPETRARRDEGTVMVELLDVLLEPPGSNIVVSAPNADWGRNAIADAIDAVRAREPDRVRSVPSFGHRAYIAAMTLAEAVVGNSSSGIIEVPLTGTPTVNIGRRQQGRPMAPSIFQADPHADSIRGAVRRALDWQCRGEIAPSLYGDGHASERIARALSTFLDTPNGS